MVVPIFRDSTFLTMYLIVVISRNRSERKGILGLTAPSYLVGCP